MWRLCHVLLAVLGLSLAEGNLQATIVLAGVSQRHSRAGPPSDRSVEAYHEAVAYLQRAPLAKRIIGHLQRSKTEYIVEIRDGEPGSKPAEFDPTYNIIRWDPRSSLRWKRSAFNSDSHSAAIALMHEFGHAFHKDIDPLEYSRRVNTKLRGGWSNSEEKRTILKVENPIARALGEAERDFHRDTGFYEAESYQALGPTTTRHARVGGPLFQALF